MKEYYSLYEAKEYLTGINKNPISENDVIDMAARGYFRLCLLLDECVVAKFELPLDNKPDVEIKRFRGYVKIPKNRLTFNYDETISIDSAEVIESYKSEDGMHHVFNSQSKQIIFPLSDQKKYKNRYVILPFEIGRRLEFEKINIEPQKIRIPAQDLLDFIENRHKRKQSKKETIPGKQPNTGAAPYSEQSEQEICDLFDPQCRQAIAALFDKIGKNDWLKHFERAKRNGLCDARQDEKKTSLYNPWKVGEWLINKGTYTREQIDRKLANNLPERSKDKKHLIIGDFD